jgi:outer membrane protein assembly factor BamB
MRRHLYLTHLEGETEGCRPDELMPEGSERSQQSHGCPQQRIERDVGAGAGRKRARRVAGACVVMIVMLFTVGGRVGAAWAGDEMTAMQVDAMHTGVVSGDAMRPPLAVLWSKTFGDEVSVPLIAGGRVFVVGSTNLTTGGFNGGTPGTSTLYALDQSTGAVLWSQPLSSGGGITYDAGRVFVYSTDPWTRIQAFRADTGAQLWSVELQDLANWAAVLADSGVVLVSGTDGAYTRIDALDESSGSTLWGATTPVAAGLTLAADATRVYAAANCAAAAYALRKGTLLWWDAAPVNALCANARQMDFPAVYAGRLYAHARPAQSGSTLNDTVNDTVYDTTDGRMMNTSFPAVYAPAFSGNSGFYLDPSASLRALDLASGAPRWTQAIPPGPFNSFAPTSPVVDNGSVYERWTDGTMIALAADTGAVQWQAPAPPNSDGAGGSEFLAIGQGLLIDPGRGQLTAYSDPDRPPVPLEQGLPAPAGSGGSPAVCTVPNLLGDTLARARHALSHAHCRLGRIKRSAPGRTLRVSRQAPAAHAQRPAGAHVNIWLGRS